MANQIQPSFAKGEVSPALHGRVDTDLYGVALGKAKNTIVHTYGGISKRPGLQYLGPVADHTYAPLLIPFQFKTTDQYMLEIGDEYIRFIRDNGYVLTETATITGITQADPAVVTTSASHGYSTGDEVFISGVVGMVQVNQNRYYITVTSGTQFELTNQVTGTDIDSTGFTAYTSGGSVGVIYEITTPYQIEDLTDAFDVPLIKYTQSADVMTLVHKDYPIQELTRTDHDNWTLSEATFGPTIDTPPDITLTVNGANNSITYRYQVTAIDRDTLEESLPGLEDSEGTITNITQADPGVVTIASHPYSDGDEVQLDNVVGMTEVNAQRYIVANSATNTFELTDIDGDNIDTTAFTAYSSAGIARRTFIITTVGTTNPDNTIAWTAVSNADHYSVYRQTNGIYGFIGDTELATFDDENIAPTTTIRPPKARNPFAVVDDYPGAVGFYEQRRVFGGSTNNPGRSEYSQTGLFSNFNRSQPTRDDDAMTVDLASQKVNEIRHYMGVNDLLIFTSGQEWRVNSGALVGFTADTIRQKPQSEWGSSDIRPVLMGNTVLYIPDDLTSVRNLLYSFQLDGYQSSDASLLSSHLLRGYRLSGAAAAVHPEGRLYMTRSDGVMLAFSFDQEQEVAAWSWFETDGEFERVAVLTAQGDDGEDLTYAIVKRTINGNTVRYLEVFGERFVDEVEDCFYVDSGITHDEPVTITDVTLADPGVVTAASHGFSDGDEVDIEDIIWVVDVDAFGDTSQPDQLNDKRYTVANSAANTFTLQDEDGDDIDTSAFNDYVSGGEVRLATDSFLGADHLEGETCVALADGNVITGITVTDGAFTTDRKFSRLHLGLQYNADIQSLPLEFGSGTIQGLPVKISRLTMRFFKSRGMFFGPKEDDLTEIKQREFENYDAPTALLTGDKEVTMPPQWQLDGGRIWIKHTTPLPMTLLALIPDVELGDN